MTHLPKSFDCQELTKILPDVLAQLRNHWNCIRWGSKSLTVELLVTLGQYVPAHDFVLVGKSVATELRFLAGKPGHPVAELLASIEPGVGLSRGSVVPASIVGTLLGKLIVTDPEVPINYLALVKNEPHPLTGLVHIASRIIVYPEDNGKPGCPHPSSQRKEIGVYE